MSLGRVARTGRRHPYVAAFLATAVVAFGAVGVLGGASLIEFAATHLLEATQVGGYENTGRDLVANMLGGATGGVWAATRGGVVRVGR